MGGGIADIQYEEMYMQLLAHHSSCISFISNVWCHSASQHCCWLDTLCMCNDYSNAGTMEACSWSVIPYTKCTITPSIIAVLFKPNDVQSSCLDALKSVCTVRCGMLLLWYLVCFWHFIFPAFQSFFCWCRSVVLKLWIRPPMVRGGFLVVHELIGWFRRQKKKES